MKTLIIDSNIDPIWWGAPDLMRTCENFPGISFSIRRAPQRDLPKRLLDYDRYILSGSFTRIDDSSDWIQELEEVVQKLVSHKKPILGICFGHQMLIRAIGGIDYVGKSNQAEFGWTKIEVDHSSILFNGLPKQFFSFSSHYDEVKRLPKDFVQLAHSNACAHQAFELRGAPVFGIQFHPERIPSEAKKVYLENKTKHQKKKIPFLGKGQDQKLYNPDIGQTIFKNFFALDGVGP